MKKLFAVSALLFALFVPVLAQAQRQLSPEDQRRFDSYYSRWQEYRHTNNREQIASMEKRMQDVYAHYGIPAGTPYWRVASNARGEWDRDNNEWWRWRNRWQGRLSADDQSRFDSYYSRWQEYRRSNNRDEAASMEKRMGDVYAHYAIPSDTPYWQVASNGHSDSDGDWDDRDRDGDRDRDRDGDHDRGLHRGWDKHDRDDDGDRDRELIPALSQQSIFPVNLPNRHAHVDKNCQGCEASEQTGYNQNSTEELRRRRKIGQPAGKSEVAHVMYVFGEAAEDLGIAVRDHNRAQDNAKREQSERLQAIQVAQEYLRQDEQITALIE